MNTDFFFTKKGLLLIGGVALFIILGSFIVSLIISIMNTHKEQVVEKNIATQKQVREEQTKDAIIQYVGEDSYHKIVPLLKSEASSSIADVTFRSGSYIKTDTSKQFILDNPIQQFSYIISVTRLNGTQDSYIGIECAPISEQGWSNASCEVYPGIGSEVVDGENDGN